MTKRQKLELRISTLRSELNDLGGQDDADRKVIDEKVEELQVLEARRRALIAAGDEGEVTRVDDAEGAELRRLEGEASVGSIFQAAIENRATEGVEKELQEHFDLAANQIPLSLLRIEDRAVTPAPNTGRTQQPVIPAVFPMSCAAHLRIPQPTVAAGEAVYPVLGTNADAADYAESAAVTEPAGSFTASVLSPRRISASFRYTREDRAKFPQIDSALRMNLSDALASGFDKYILTKDEVGLLDLSDGPLTDADESSEMTFASYRSSLYSRVDGRYAHMASDVRMVVGSATYAHMSTKYRGNNADTAAVDLLMEKSGGLKVSAHVPAMDATSKAQQAVMALGMARHAVAPIWNGVTIIPDEVTGASKGEIVLTAIMLAQFKVLRAAGFKKIGYKIAA